MAILVHIGVPPDVIFMCMAVGLSGRTAVPV